MSKTIAFGIQFYCRQLVWHRWLQKLPHRVKGHKIMVSTLFKVIQGQWFWYKSYTCMQFLF